MLRSLALVSLALVTGCATSVRHLPPAEPGLPFSNGVMVGNTFYVAGHLGLDKETRTAPSDPAVEAGLMLDSFSGTLERVGLTMNDLVSVQVFCSDVSLYGTFNDIYRERFDGEFPARAFIGSGKLLRGCRFEMNGVAVKR